MRPVEDDDVRTSSWSARPHFDREAWGARSVRQFIRELACVRRVSKPQEAAPETRCPVMPAAIDFDPDQPSEYLIASADGNVQASADEMDRAIDDASIFGEKDSRSPVTFGNALQRERPVRAPHHRDSRVFLAASRAH